MSESQKPFGQLYRILNALSSLKSTIQSLNFKTILRRSLAFVSIISAYLTIVFSFQVSSVVNLIFKIKIKQIDALPRLLLSISLSLICWQISGYLLKKRAMRPPPKNSEYQEYSQKQQQLIIQLPVLEQGKKYSHQVIFQSIKASIYFLLIVLAISAKAYFQQKLTIQKTNYIVVWGFMAINTYISGSLLTEWTNCKQFKLFGISLSSMIVIGLLLLTLHYDPFQYI